MSTPTNGEPTNDPSRPSGPDAGRHADPWQQGQQPGQQPGQPGWGQPPTPPGYGQQPPQQWGGQQPGQPQGGYPAYQQQPGSGYGYPQGGYQQPNLFPGVQGARPTSAGLQIGASIVDNVILGIVFTILGFVSFIPFFATIGSLPSGGTRRYDPELGTYRSTLTDAQESALAGSVAGSFALMAVVFLIVGIVLWWWLATRGKSVGNAIFGLRLVGQETGQPIGWGATLLRGLLMSVTSALTSGIMGILFLLSPLFDTNTGWFQAWQDRLFKGVVINTREGQDTYRGAKQR